MTLYHGLPRRKSGRNSGRVRQQFAKEKRLHEEREPKSVYHSPQKEPQLRDFRDTKLLSFGADADEEAEGLSTVVKKKSVARPDCEWLSVRIATYRIYLDT
jgi:hypothetical protein